MLKFVSVLGNTAGFYSNFFFVLNHYIHCKKRNLAFRINSENWIYKFKDGWTDYFEPFAVNVDYCAAALEMRMGHTDHIELYPIREYEIAIREIYKFNETTKEKIAEVKSRLGLEEGKYDAIYIRRGDKLADENVFRPVSLYINLLLKKNPDCEVLFLQTDDYTSVLEAEEYISHNKKNILLITTCSKNARGSITTEKYKKDLALALHYKTRNYEYISKIATELTDTTTLSDMDPDTIYNHTIDLLSSVDITAHSNICVTDYESNVGRFIKLAHVHPANVFDVLAPDSDINYNVYECPAYHF
jgi:hypothetical protein